MFIDENSEYRLLASCIDRPEYLLKLTERIFSRNRVDLFKAMKSCFLRYGELSYEGVESFYGKPVPNEVEASRGAKPDAIIDRLKDLATRRMLVEKQNSLSNIISSSEPLERKDLQKLLEIEPIMVEQDSSITPGVNGFISDLQRKVHGQYRFVKTGIRSLDKMMGGEYQRQCLTVVIGAPGGGKTALVCSSMINMAKDYEIPSLFFSLEMRRSAIVSRMVANIAEIDGLKLREGKIDDEEYGKINTALHTIQKYPFYIIDNPGMTVDDIDYEVRKHKRDNNVEVVFIDYLQIINYKSGEKDWETLGYIVQRLRNIAVNNDLSLVLLSQQNRSGDGLDSIFGSSRVSQISDVVFQVSIDDIVSDDVKMAEFNFLKNRNGPLGTIQNHYYPKYLRFV